MIAKRTATSRLSLVALGGALGALFIWPQPAAAHHILGITPTVVSVNSVTRTVTLDVDESTANTSITGHTDVNVFWGSSTTTVPWTSTVPGMPAHYKVLGLTHVYPDLTDRSISVVSDCCNASSTLITVSFDVVLGCTDTPMGACTAATGAQFQLKNDSDNTKDKLKFKWAGTSTFASHDPTGTVEYHLCAYAAGSLINETVIPPGAPWETTGSGFKYKDKAGTVLGVTGAKLKDGQIKLKGKGGSLPDPAMPLTEPVIVQIQTSDGACFGTTLAMPAPKNTAEAYKGKFP